MPAIEIRSDERSNTVTLSTYASLFEPVSYPIGGGNLKYTESVARGAFNATLASRPDVVFRAEHGGPPLARTTAGNLTLTLDPKGLRYEARLDTTDPDVQALVPKLRNGNYRESSFAFRCVQDDWNSDYTRRRLVELDINRGDVSIVTFGASPETGNEVSLRAQSREERRALAEAVSHERVELRTAFNGATARSYPRDRDHTLVSLVEMRRELGMPPRTGPDEERWKMSQVEDVIRRNRASEREFRERLDRRRPR